MKSGYQKESKNLGGFVSRKDWVPRLNFQPEARTDSGCESVNLANYDRKIRGLGAAPRLARIIAPSAKLGLSGQRVAGR